MVSPCRLVPCVALCACLAGASAAASAVSDPAAAKAKELLRDLPLRFEPNLGQWNPEVRFSGRAADSTVFLTSREAVLSIPGPAGKPAHTVSLSLRGSNRSPRIEGLDLLSSRSNYFTGARKENWRTGVVQYGKVRYAEVYPGIDMVYYGSRKHLEYDFVLAPGADPHRIRLAFRGARRLSLTSDGDLVVETSGGQLIQKRPYIYQGTRQVGGGYRLLGRNMAGIELDRYDATRMLTIDPVLSYATLLGGTGTDGIAAVKVDSNGKLWVAGYIGTNDYGGTDGSYQPASAGVSDAFLAEIDPTAWGGNSLLYFTYLGGTDADAATDLALDSSGAVYLTGTTSSTDFPLAGTGLQAANAGGEDSFVVKLVPSAQGTDALFYSSYLGGTDIDEAHGIAVDGNGLIYVTGTTHSDDFPLTGTAYQNARWGSTDAFVTKIDPTSATPLLYSSYLGGETLDEGRSIAVTADGGKVYVGGATESVNFPYTGGTAFRLTYQGGVDGFISQLDLSQSGPASLVYSSYFGGTGWDEITKIALDPNGKLLVTGFTLSSDFPVTGNAFQLNPPANGAAFAVRMDLTVPPQNQLLYSTYLGGSGGAVGLDVAGDAAGNIYVSGYTQSSDFPVTSDAVQSTWGFGADAFVTELSPTGTLVYSTYLGQSGTHLGNSIGLGANGTLFVGGVTASPGVQPTPSGYQRSYGGGLSDGFLLVLTPQ